jgi:hypothetical protein
MFGEITTQSIEWDLAIGEGFDPGIAGPEQYAWVQVVIEANAKQALLPFDDQLIAPPLVFTMYAELVVEPERPKCIVPAYGSIGVGPVVLRMRCGAETKAYDEYYDKWYASHKKSWLPKG